MKRMCRIISAFFALSCFSMTSCNSTLDFQGYGIKAKLKTAVDKCVVEKECCTLLFTFTPDGNFQLTDSCESDLDITVEKKDASGR